MRKRATVKLRLALRELGASRELVIIRSRGLCERCGKPGHVAHHRRPRMAGGSTAIGMNAPANLVWLDNECHLDVESHRDAAREAGWLLTDVRHAERVAVRHHTLGWVRLLNDGTYEDAPDGAA